MAILPDSRVWLKHGPGPFLVEEVNGSTVKVLIGIKETRIYQISQLQEVPPGPEITKMTSDENKKFPVA